MGGGGGHCSCLILWWRGTQGHQPVCSHRVLSSNPSASHPCLNSHLPDNPPHLLRPRGWGLVAGARELDSRFSGGPGHP